MKKKYLIPALMMVSTAVALPVAADWGERGEKGHGEHCERGHGNHMMFQQRDKALSAEQVRTLVTAHLIMRGDDRLKVGKISEKDENTYSVEIVTVDDSLVRTVEIDRNTGFPMGRRHN